MSAPSWKQFAAIPFDATVAAVVSALDITPPDEGRPRSFQGPGKFLAAITPAGLWLVYEAGSSRYVDGPDDVRAAAKLPAGTPSGDALRQWLSWWGWVPPSKRSAPEPQEQTKMVI
jgi:hypothetical protein